MSETVLVTGGAGYIGSHVVVELLDEGYDVVVIDNLSTGHRQLVDDRARLVVADIADRQTLRNTIDKSGVDAVLHFAGSILVSESVEKPLHYYGNNTSKARRLIETCVDCGVEYIVFSSTAAVYGDPQSVPLKESDPTRPVNPYGRSKLAVEWMLEDVSSAHDLRHVSLRYFNVAGADPEGRTGQVTDHATHLIQVALQAALGIRPKLEIYGTDYPTDDGTCIRDYIHVSDLASIHVAALRHLASGGNSQTLNCGYGRGFSVRQVIDTVRRVSDTDFPVIDAPRRPGDPARLVADSSALRQLLDWSPQHDDLDQIVASALAFERRWHAAGAVT